MKRSEMIKKIDSALMTEIYNSGDITINSLDKREIAKMILSVIEEEGMLPPPNGDEDVMGVSIHEWNSEIDPPKKAKDPNACCDNERRSWAGGCLNCGDPCL